MKVISKTISFSFILFLFISCKFVSCNDLIKPPPPLTCSEIINSMKEQDTNTNKPLCIVLCDFTSSMDTNSLQYVRKEALKIFNHYYGKYSLKFYPITNQNLQPFFESEMISITDSFLIERNTMYQYQDCLNKLRPRLADSLQTALIDRSQNRPPETYIIQSLESTFSLIDSQDPQHKNKMQLFILSDMLEYGSSSFGTIDLENHSYTQEVKKIIGQKDTTFFFKKPLENIAIHIGLYSEQIKDFHGLSSFWDSVFYQLGYQGAVSLNREVVYPN